MGHILIIDGDRTAGEMLSRVIVSMGHEISWQKSAATGLAAAQSEYFDVVCLDVLLPDGNWLDLMIQIRNLRFGPVVLIMTAHGDPNGAELAINNGAWDYITKPISRDRLKHFIQGALDHRKAKQALYADFTVNRGGIIGKSQALNRAIEDVMKVSSGNANVLIQGETGSGKELFARAVHENSSRSQNRFVTVDCATLPDTIVENLLFGHAKGAFTGANQSTGGLIRQADGGTLFLDEIGELPWHVQKNFLRVLQEKCFMPVGSNKIVKSDFRLVSATNKNLEKMVERREYREDLFFRIGVYTINVPPLRERVEDIDMLLDYYMDKLCRLTGINPKIFTQDYLEIVHKYSWPGNVRELFNSLEHSVASAKMESRLLPIHLPLSIRAKVSRDLIQSELHDETSVQSETDIIRLVGPPPSLKEFRFNIEQVYLQRVINYCGGNRQEACKITGISRTRLFELLKKHALSGT